MNCWWLFLVLPWHPICAQAALQLGTDSKKHLLKRQLVKSENYSFPTHDKEGSSTVTDLFFFNTTECKVNTGWQSDLLALWRIQILYVDFPISDQDISRYGLRFL